MIECVPNVSEGRDPALLARFAGALRLTPGITLMNVHADPDHHRSVYSYIGEPEAVQATTLALAEVVLETVDLRRHAGQHPRLGALDVVPFVPLAGTGMAETVALAHRVGQALAERHGVPVYYYGCAAIRATRRRLPDARGRGYEALAERMRGGDTPDAGPARFDPRAGAVLVGARDILVAFNVWLDGDDVAAAQAIARTVRESGGGLPAVQALGMRLDSRAVAQVSMNLLDYRVTSIPAAFDRVGAEAARRGIAILKTELVGVAPVAAFAGRTPASVGLIDFSPDLLLDTYLPAGEPPARG